MLSNKKKNYLTTNGNEPDYIIDIMEMNNWVNTRKQLYAYNDYEKIGMDYIEEVCEKKYNENFKSDIFYKNEENIDFKKLLLEEIYTKLIVNDYRSIEIIEKLQINNITIDSLISFKNIRIDGKIEDCFIAICIDKNSEEIEKIKKEIDKILIVTVNNFKLNISDKRIISLEYNLSGFMKAILKYFKEAKKNGYSS